MKVKFIETVDLGVHHFNEGDIIELNEDDPMITELNDEYYIFVYRGIRFDLHKNSVEFLDE